MPPGERLSPFHDKCSWDKCKHLSLFRRPTNCFKVRVICPERVHCPSAEDQGLGKYRMLSGGVGLGMAGWQC